MTITVTLCQGCVVRRSLRQAEGCGAMVPLGILQET